MEYKNTQMLNGISYKQSLFQSMVMTIKTAQNIEKASIKIGHDQMTTNTQFLSIKRANETSLKRLFQDIWVPNAWTGFGQLKCNITSIQDTATNNDQQYLPIYISDIMNESFLQAEDWAPLHRQPNSLCWSSIVRIIEQFEQLIVAQKKQIVECIKELTSNRVQLIKQFHRYKSSLKYQGEMKKEQVSIYDSDKARVFFKGYYQQLQQIVTKIGSNPVVFARILAEAKIKKIQSFDFVQSLLYHLYPCYMPLHITPTTPSNYLSFMEEIINQWSYDIRLGRPKNYTVIDQIINGFNKVPDIVCFVQKISISFMKNVNQCNMGFFAFDEHAIKNQYEIKRNLALSQNAVVSQSRWGKFKSMFKKEQGIPDTYSVASEVSELSQGDVDIEQIMKSRQRQFVNVVTKTIESILGTQVPFILKEMMKFFHSKIKRQMEPSQQESKKVASETNEQSEMSESSNFQSKSQTKTHVSDESQKGDKKQYYRHYCYFLLTNLICEELHNKFTISHEDKGMKPADLQNITEIIKIVTQIFQGEMPKGEKYKNQKLKQLDRFLVHIPNFYDKIMNKITDEEAQDLNVQNFEKDQESGGHKIREILLDLHQNTLLLSFNDIRNILELVHSSSLRSQLQLTKKAEQMNFFSGTERNSIYDSSTKKIIFSNISHEPEKIFFIFNSQKPSDREVVDYYIGSESPLKDVSLLTNSIIKNSNLGLKEALEVAKSFELIRSLSLKQAKYFLNKIMARFNNLQLRDNEALSQKFRQTFAKNLNRNIIRKSVLLLHRDEICSRVASTQKLMEFYTVELRSSQFYQSISRAFINNIKIKVILRIENEELRIYQNLDDIKQIKVQSILCNHQTISVSDTTKTKRQGQEFALRNSCRIFTSIKDIITSLSRNKITEAALCQGKKIDEFNEMFSKLCSIIISYIEEFMKGRQVLHNLNKQKLAKTIVSKIQNQIYEKQQFQQIRAKGVNTIDKDKVLIAARTKVNKNQFFKKDLQEINIDWNFLSEQGTRKFELMIQQESIMQKIRHFEELFRMVFTIIGFSIAKSKISAEMINPIIQYLVLIADVNKQFECLYSLKCLKWNTSPETSYNIILYESSLTYICESMATDYPLCPREM